MNQEKLKKLSHNLLTNRNNYMESFRKNIDMYLEQKDVTLRELSEQANIPAGTLSSLLYSSQKDCKLSTAVSLARVLGISIDEVNRCRGFRFINKRKACYL